MLACTGLLALPWSALQAQVADYALDPVHTRVMLAVDHGGFSNAIGTVSGSSGRIRFDPADWQAARLEVRVPLQRLDFGDARWNRAVLAGNLLDAARHPEAHFVASDITPVSPVQARACGQLTLRGTTGPFCMDVVFNQLRRHPLPPFRQTIGFSARGELSRSAFGITAWPGVIGDTVALRIEVEATRTGTNLDIDAEVDASPPMTDEAPTDALLHAADALAHPPTEDASDATEKHP